MSDKNLAPYVRIRELDANGNPLAGGKLYTYRTGTSTAKQTYSDGDGTANANPVVLDSEGSADVWIDDDEPYRFRLETSTGALRWQRDGVTNASGSVLRGVSNIAALKLISGSATATTIIDVSGYYAPLDGGGGATSGGGRQQQQQHQQEQQQQQLLRHPWERQHLLALGTLYFLHMFVPLHLNTPNWRLQTILRKRL